MKALNEIQSYEGSLSREMLRVLRQYGAVIYGVAEDEQIAGRVPTICFNIPGKSPAKVTEAMASAGIGIRDGHMYSPRLMSRLGLSNDTGAIRASLVHYNTFGEIHEFESVLRDFVHHA